MYVVQQFRKDWDVAYREIASWRIVGDLGRSSALRARLHFFQRFHNFRFVLSATGEKQISTTTTSLHGDPGFSCDHPWS